MKITKQLILALTLVGSSAFAGPQVFNGKQGDLIKTLLSKYDSCTVSPFGPDSGTEAYEVSKRSYVLSIICKTDGPIKELVTLNYSEVFSTKDSSTSWKKID